MLVSVSKPNTEPAGQSDQKLIVSGPESWFSAGKKVVFFPWKTVTCLVAVKTTRRGMKPAFPLNLCFLTMLRYDSMFYCTISIFSEV